MYYPAIFLISLSHRLSYTMVRVCRLRWRINFEFFIVIAIVAIAAVLAVKSFVPLITTAKLTHATGRLFIDTRVDAMLYHAINGYWPKDNAVLQGVGGHADFKKIQDPYIEKALVDEGAIHLYFSKDLAGEVLTLRPAVPFGGYESMIWVCGNQRSADEWTVVGKDKTTFENRYILRQLW